MRPAEAFGFVLTYVCSHMRPEATTVSGLKLDLKVQVYEALRY
jgi:hypothetical protein